MVSHYPNQRQLLSSTLYLTAPIDGLNLDFRLAPKNRDVLRQRNANRMSTDHLNNTYPLERPRMNNPLVPNANKTRIFTNSLWTLLS